MKRIRVAPLVGAWIEIIYENLLNLREIRVAPLVGAWIEILSMRIDTKQETVAPLVGAWIEIQKTQKQMQRRLSLLSWERGLKLVICTI